jgi:hypothetical protein|tara:strand:- start:12923 stop:13315 length:393 start_codon:yes stop_codon:yes gene_type:complete
MIQAEAYQDIQILQDSDFENVITFDSTHDMVGKSFKAYIAKDYKSTAFTGPSLSGSTWSSDAAATRLAFIIATGSNSVTLTLPAEATTYFTDGWEGVWDLLEKDADDTSYKRQIQGDVIVSNSIAKVGDF